MRHELSIDNRNEVKWHEVLTAAGDSHHPIVYAGFITPDIHRDGKHLTPWAKHPILPTVRAFFISERHRVHLGGNKDLWRISALDSRIRCVTDVYVGTDAGKSAYADKVLEAVRAHRVGDGPILLLCDPCNGVADGTRTRNNGRDHIVSGWTVRLMWNRLRPGDMLLIYQSRDHCKDAYGRPLGILVRDLDIPASAITVADYGPISMLKLFR